MLEQLNEFFDCIPEEERNLFQRIAEIALDNGYRIRRDKVKHIAYSFVSPRCKNGMMRFAYDKGKLFLKMKFFGVADYSEKFLSSLRATIEEHHFKYTGCYGCGKCNDQKEGYTILYENGMSYFRCGSEYIDIMNVEASDIAEIERIIVEQTHYYERMLPQSPQGEFLGLQKRRSAQFGN